MPAGTGRRAAEQRVWGGAGVRAGGWSSQDLTEMRRQSPRGGCERNGRECSGGQTLVTGEEDELWREMKRGGWARRTLGK